MANTLQTPLKQAKTTVDRLGNTQLRVGKRFKISGWLLFDGIVLIIIISVATLRFTHAGANYSFLVNPAQMQGGELKRSVVDGSYRQLVSNGIHAETSAVATTEQIKASKQVCADMRVRSNNTFIDVQFNGKYANKFVTQAGQATVCVELGSQAQGGTIYAGTSGNADVYQVYGTSQ